MIVSFRSLTQVMVFCVSFTLQLKGSPFNLLVFLLVTYKSCSIMFSANLLVCHLLYGCLFVSFVLFILLGECADVVFIMDESNSMQRAHEWIRGFVLNLESRLRSFGLGTSRVCLNRYGLVGFGQRAPNHNARVIQSIESRAMVSASELALLSQDLNSDREGRLEDGYEAISTSMQRLQLRSRSSKFAVLVTDEDRDITLRGRYISRSTIKNTLLQNNMRLLAVVDNRFTANSEQALGLGDGRSAFLERPSCNITKTSSNVRVGWGFANTTQDYTTLALEVGGGAFNIRYLQQPAVSNAACSFTTAVAQAIVEDACSRTRVRRSMTCMHKILY